MGDDEYLKIFGPLSFKAAEKFFKFTSWAIIISVISYAKEMTGSTVLEWMYVVSIIVFTLALMIQSIVYRSKRPR